VDHRSAHKPVRPAVIIALFCGSLLAVGYYSFYLGANTARRENSLNEIDGMANSRNGIEAKTAKLLGRRARVDSQISEPELKAMTRMSEESAVLRGRFLALEARIRANNNDVLPRWLKDDPNWQELDRVYRRNPE
jgi:hypothetical protein